jgi:hypothetical protein
MQWQEFIVPVDVSGSSTANEQAAEGKPFHLSMFYAVRKWEYTIFHGVMIAPWLVQYDLEGRPWPSTHRTFSDGQLTDTTSRKSTVGQAETRRSIPWSVNSRDEILA